MAYKNNTKLPAGVEFVRISSFSPENVTTKSVKEHIIEWSDTNKRNIESITINEFNSDWNKVINSTITITNKELSENDNGIYKLNNGNKGVLVNYRPFKPSEYYELWFIVSIKLVGETAFDIAFYSCKFDGNPPTQGDANKPAGGG